MAHEPENPVALDQEPADDLGLPAGDHPLEVAARRGFGPLSPLSAQAWHGQARPCVSCGQLVERGTKTCDACGQDLSEEMLEKMRQHAGPWYVLEHLRPFPGVSLERIVRQIRRGLITETSIVRGPATDYQWRFAVETPSLCRYFGRCWSCHHEVSPADTYCPSCLTHLSFQRFPEPREPEPARAGAGVATRPHSTAELTKPLTSAHATRPGPSADATKPFGAAEMIKPAGVSDVARPTSLGGVAESARPAAAGATAEARPASASVFSVPRPLSAAPRGLAGSAPVVLPRHDPAREASLPFEPRPAAPVASPIGLPDSTPIFGTGHRTSVGASPVGVHAGAPSAMPFATSGSRVAKSTSPELAKLATAVASFDQVPREAEPSSRGLSRIAWIAGAVVVIAIVTLIALARS